MSTSKPERGFCPVCNPGAGHPGFAVRRGRLSNHKRQGHGYDAGGEWYSGRPVPCEGSGQPPLGAPGDPSPSVVEYHRHVAAERERVAAIRAAQEAQRVAAVERARRNGVVPSPVEVTEWKPGGSFTTVVEERPITALVRSLRKGVEESHGALTMADAVESMIIAVRRAHGDAAADALGADLQATLETVS